MTSPEKALLVALGSLEILRNLFGLCLIKFRMGITSFGGRFLWGIRFGSWRCNLGVERRLGALRWSLEGRIWRASLLGVGWRWRLGGPWLEFWIRRHRLPRERAWKLWYQASQGALSARCLRSLACKPGCQRETEFAEMNLKRGQSCKSCKDSIRIGLQI